MDLDFDEFFLRVNGTSSCVGQQYLYDRFRRIPHEPEMVEYNHILEYLKNNPEFASRCRKQLSGLAHHDAYYICSLFQEKPPVPSPRMIHFARILQLMPALFTGFFVIFPKTIWFLLIVIFFIINMILHYRNKQKLFVYLYSFPQLLKLVSIVKKLSSEAPFATVHPDILIRLQSLQPLVHRLSHFRFDMKFENDTVAIIRGMKE